MSTQSPRESTSSPGAVLAAAEAASGSQQLTSGSQQLTVSSSSGRELKRGHSDESAHSSAKRTPSERSRGSVGLLPPVIPVAHPTGTDHQNGTDDEDTTLADLLHAERSHSAAGTPRRTPSPAASTGGHWSMQGPGKATKGHAGASPRGAHGSPAGGQDSAGSSATSRGAARGPYGHPSQSQGVIRASPNTGIIGAEGGIVRPAPSTVAAAADVRNSAPLIRSGGGGGGDDEGSWMGSDPDLNSDIDMQDVFTLLHQERNIGIEINQTFANTQNVIMQDSVLLNQRIDKQENLTFQQVQLGVAASDVAALQQQAEGYAREREASAANIVRSSAEVIHQQQMQAVMSEANREHRTRVEELQSSHAVIVSGMRLEVGEARAALQARDESHQQAMLDLQVRVSNAEAAAKTNFAQAEEAKKKAEAYRTEAQSRLRTAEAQVSGATQQERNAMQEVERIKAERSKAADAIEEEIKKVHLKLRCEKKELQDALKRATSGGGLQGGSTTLQCTDASCEKVKLLNMSLDAVSVGRDELAKKLQETEEQLVRARASGGSHAGIDEEEKKRLLKTIEDRTEQLEQLQGECDQLRGNTEWLAGENSRLEEDVSEWWAYYRSWEGQDAQEASTGVIRASPNTGIIGVEGGIVRSAPSPFGASAAPVDAAISAGHHGIARGEPTAHQGGGNQAVPEQGGPSAPQPPSGPPLPGRGGGQPPEPPPGGGGGTSREQAEAQIAGARSVPNHTSHNQPKHLPAGVKEADHIRIDKYPAAYAVKDWRVKLVSSVQSASGRSDHAAVHWLNRAAGDKIPITDLEDVPYQFFSLDSKLLTALIGACAERMLTRLTQLNQRCLELKNKPLSSLVALREIYNSLRTTSGIRRVAVITDLALIQYHGDPYLTEFRDHWYELIADVGDIIPEETLAQLLARHFDKSHILKPEAAHWRRLDDNDPNKCYRWLEDAMDKAIARQQEDSNAASRRNHINHKLGATGKGKGFPAADGNTDGQWGAHGASGFDGKDGKGKQGKGRGNEKGTKGAGKNDPKGGGGPRWPLGVTTEAEFALVRRTDTNGVLPCIGFYSKVGCPRQKAGQPCYYSHEVQFTGPERNSMAVIAEKRKKAEQEYKENSAKQGQGHGGNGKGKNQPGGGKDEHKKQGKGQGERDKPKPPIKSNQPCRSWEKDKTCTFGDNCRYVHADAK